MGVAVREGEPGTSPLHLSQALGGGALPWVWWELLGPLGHPPSGAPLDLSACGRDLHTPRGARGPCSGLPDAVLGSPGSLVEAVGPALGPLRLRRETPSRPSPKCLPRRCHPQPLTRTFSPGPVADDTEGGQGHWWL